MFLLWYIFATCLCQNRKGKGFKTTYIPSSEERFDETLSSEPFFKQTLEQQILFWGGFTIFSSFLQIWRFYRGIQLSKNWWSDKIQLFLSKILSCKRRLENHTNDNWHFVFIVTPFLDKIQMPPMTLVACIPMFDPYPFVRCSFLQTETCMFYLRKSCSIFPMQRPLFFVFFVCKKNRSMNRNPVFSVLFWLITSIGLFRNPSNPWVTAVAKFTP